MTKLSQDPVFEPINDLFDELVAGITRARDKDMADTNVKVALMQAYQRGKNEVLEEVTSWLP